MMPVQPEKKVVFQQADSQLSGCCSCCFSCVGSGGAGCVCVLLYFGTEYQNARSFEIILQIHLLICYLLDFIIYLFIELTLFVSYAFMFVTAGVRFVPKT